ncbi:MAG: ABC transporter permease [Cytophagaceae bacterium]|nr:ABC transporter permease [Gemmatimonadaceae bacterium]
MSRVLTSLVRLFPRAFRERFGAGMRETIRHDWHQARCRGAGVSTWFAISTAFDLVRSAAAEHFNPTWAGRYEAPARRSGMRRLIDEWTRDLRHAVRALRRSPGFTLVTAGTLGLAIGANAGIFSVVDTVLLDPLPYAHADRLVHIAASAPGSDFPAEFGPSAEFLVHYKERSKLIEDVSTYNSFTSTLRTPDRVERIRMSQPTNSMFSTLGARPMLGRLPVDEDEERVFVLSHALWQSWFGGDSAVLGKTFDVLGGMRTVVGIMGPEFEFPGDGTMLWVSSRIRSEGITPGRFGQSLVARVVPGTTPEALARELNGLAAQLPERFGGSANYAKLIGQHRAVVRPLATQMLGSVSQALWVLFGAVGIVLLIACANVANLFLVRAEGRQREIAVRRAIGAARGQLIRLQLAEAGVIAVLAGGVAVLLAAMSLPALVRAAPPGIFRITEAGLNARMLGFTLLVAMVSALICGLYPAARASAPDLTRLREGGRGSTRTRRWVRDGLVVAQTALALVLLIGSGLLVRSFQALRDVDPGYDTENVFSFQIAPEGPHLRDGEAYARFDMDFMARLRALPGVEAVGLVENIPLNEGTVLVPFRTEATADAEAGKRLDFTFAAGDYFKAMGISVRSGQVFAATTLDPTRGTVVVSQLAANQLWPGRDAVGQRVQRAGDSTWFTVIGVVEDVLQDDFREAPRALVYFPLVGPTPGSWAITSPAYVIKTPRAETIAPEIRALVREVAPEAPMYRTYTMAQLEADSMVSLSFTMLTLGIASMLALVLGAVGLYGVLSYVVAERTREIGVRMALGARAEQVRRMVVAQGARVVGIGAIIGIVVALASTRLLGSMLFGVAALDWMTFAAMSLSLIAVGLLASYIPARRASAVPPMESLRGD